MNKLKDAAGNEAADLLSASRRVGALGPEQDEVIDQILERLADPYELCSAAPPVRKSASFGPVVLLTADQASRARIVDDCKSPELCEFITSGRIQIRVVTHEGPWIRDYGPQIELTKNGPKVVHWRYYDTRQDDSAKSTRESVNNQRLALIALESKILRGDDDELHSILGEEGSDAELAKLDKKLNLLGQMDGILANANTLQRTTDEQSAFDVAQAVLRSPNFEYISSPSSVDGGNLIHMGDGRCLTTRTLLSRNQELGASVERELLSKGSCSRVTYLEPLPGPVIEHVDMFVASSEEFMGERGLRELAK